MKAGPAMKAAPYLEGVLYLKADPYQEGSPYLKSGPVLKNDLYLKTRTQQNAVCRGHMTGDPNMTNRPAVDEEYTLIYAQQSTLDHTERGDPQKTKGRDYAQRSLPGAHSHSHCRGQVPANMAAPHIQGADSWAYHP